MTRSDLSTHSGDSRYRPVLVLLVCTAAALCSACADLAAVRSFAKTSATVAGYRDAADDYASAVQRRERFVPPDRRDALEVARKEHEDQLGELEKAQKVLSAYMSALGDLAADKAANFDGDWDKVADSLKKGKLVTDDVASGATTIGKIVTKLVAEGWRQRQLGTIIRDNNESFGKFVAALHQALTGPVKFELDEEEKAIKVHYGNVLSAYDSATVVPVVAVRSAEKDLLDAVEERPIELKKVAQSSLEIAEGHAALSVFLIREAQQDRLDAVAAKKLALDKYAASLKKIADGHAALAAKWDKLSDQQVTALATQYASDLSDLLGAIESLKK